MWDFKVVGWAIALFSLVAFIAFFESRAVSADTGAVSVGSGIRYICQTSAPAPVGRARSWVRCSDGALMYTSAVNVDAQVDTGAGAATWDAASPATLCKAQGTGISGGSDTVGTEIYTTAAATITGGSFFWGDGSAANIRVTLWNTSGAALATVDVAVSGVGLYTGTFPSTVAASAYTLYWITIWEKTGTSFAAQYAITRPSVYALGPAVALFAAGFSAGNAQPASTAGGFYPVAPTLTVP